MKWILYSLTIITCYSCIPDFTTDWTISTYEQDILDSKLKIVEYDAWGGLDSHQSGKKIMLRNDTFGQEDVLKSDRFAMLEQIPDKDTIKIIEFDRSRVNEDSYLPVSMTFTKMLRATVKRTVYSYTGAVLGPCTYKRVKFDTIVETIDSIYFTNCVSAFVNKTEYGDRLFAKGNVYANLSSDTVTDISIKVLLLNEVEPKICVQTWSLMPSKTIHKDQLSRRGIYFNQ